jgi:hypothetical protein
LRNSTVKLLRNNDITDHYKIMSDDQALVEFVIALAVCPGLIVWVGVYSVVSEGIDASKRWAEKFGPLPIYCYLNPFKNDELLTKRYAAETPSGSEAKKILRPVETGLAGKAPHPDAAPNRGT